MAVEHYAWDRLGYTAQERMFHQIHQQQQSIRRHLAEADTPADELDTAELEEIEGSEASEYEPAISIMPDAPAIILSG